MSHELYKRLRPKTAADFFGNGEVVLTLKKWEKNPKKIPHTILLHGPSGCGKTTTGRILKKLLGVTQKSDHNFVELNCADFRGIDTVRDMRNTMSLSAMGGGNRIWFLDEVHKLTNDAQNGMLKILEDTPDHVYFILATTEPEKIIPTVRGRCYKLSMKRLELNDARRLCKFAWKESGAEAKLRDEVIDKVIDAAEGSARELLVILDQIKVHKKSKDMIESIVKSSTKTAAIAIARALLQSRAQWRDVAAVLKEHQEEDAEKLRWMVLGYCKAILLNGKADRRAAIIIDLFRDNFFDCKYAGLVSACFSVVDANRK